MAQGLSQAYLQAALAGGQARQLLPILCAHIQERLAAGLLVHHLQARQAGGAGG